MRAERLQQQRQLLQRRSAAVCPKPDFIALDGLRVLAGNKGQHIPAGIWGKHKTIWQIVTVPR